MRAGAIDGDRLTGDAATRIDGDHHVRGAEAEEPAALDAEEPHLVLGVIDHQAIDGAHFVPRAIQDFPAPDVLIGVRHRLAIAAVSTFPCTSCCSRPIPGAHACSKCAAVSASRAVEVPR
jgi:hypothetical protein